MAIEMRDGSADVNPAAFTFVTRELPITTIVGSDTLPWAQDNVILVTKRINTIPACTVASAVETNRRFKTLYTEMSDDQRIVAKAVFEFEVINFMHQRFWPDQSLINPEKGTPEIFRVNHNNGKDSIAVFFTRARGILENSRFFFVGASQMNRADMALSELGQYGYVDKTVSGNREKALMPA